MSAKILDFQEYKRKKEINELYEEASGLVEYLSLEELESNLEILNEDLEMCRIHKVQDFLPAIKSEIELIKLAIEIYKK